MSKRFRHGLIHLLCLYISACAFTTFFAFQMLFTQKECQLLTRPGIQGPPFRISTVTWLKTSDIVVLISSQTHQSSTRLLHWSHRSSPRNILANKSMAQMRWTKRL